MVDAALVDRKNRGVHFKSSGSPSTSYGDMGDVFVSGVAIDLHSGWRDELVAAVVHSARLIDLDGSHSSARDRETTYSAAPGSRLMRDVPWLLDLYRGPLLDLARWLDPRSQEDASHLLHAIDASEFPEALFIGLVLLPGMRYEDHVDTWPAGINLYLRTGGDLKAGTTAISARPGAISFVRATNTVHGVEARGERPERWDLNDPDQVASARISLNFNYTTADFSRRARAGEVDLPQQYILGEDRRTVG